MLGIATVTSLDEGFVRWWICIGGKGDEERAIVTHEKKKRGGLLRVWIDSLLSLTRC